MASPTQWTWVWVNSGSWWWTGRPDMLWSMWSQRVGHDWVTDMNWTEVSSCGQPHAMTTLLGALECLGMLETYKLIFLDLEQELQTQKPTDDQNEWCGEQCRTSGEPVSILRKALLLSTSKGFPSKLSAYFSRFFYFLKRIQAIF